MHYYLPSPPDESPKGNQVKNIIALALIIHIRFQAHINVRLVFVFSFYFAFVVDVLSTDFYF